MNMLTSALSAIASGVVLLSVLVFVHEGGHYLMARAFGVRVTEFFLGLPSRFKLSFKSKSHGTEFGVTPVLLGGYNRICGMEGVRDELSSRAFAIVQREGRVSAESVATELGIDLDRSYTLLVGLSDLAAIRPYYDASLGERPNQRDYPASFETLMRDDKMLTEYDKGHDFSRGMVTADGEPRPLDDPQAQLAIELSHTYQGCSFIKRVLIVLAGPVVNLLLAFAIVTGAYMSIEYQVPLNTNEIGAVTQGSLAEASGLRAGDVIVDVDGNPVEDWVGVSEQLANARTIGEDFELSYVRNGAESVVLIDLPEGEEIEFIGISARMESYRLTLGEAARSALDYASMVGGVALRLIMPQHTMEVLDSSTSIVGISVMASQAVTSGLFDVLVLMAAISMSLGFMNLLPIPPLDGGKILIELIQLVLRRPLSMRAQTAMSYLGVAFFAFVFVVVLRNDVLRFVISG